MTPERDQATSLSAVTAIGPAVLSADNTPAAIDLLGFAAATLILAIGAGGITFTATNKVEFVLTHSEDGDTYTAVTDDDLVKDTLAPATVENGVVRALTSAHADPTLQTIGYVGGKRYLKLLADFSGTHETGTPIAASVVRGLGALRGAA